MELISGVKYKELKVACDARGRLMEVLRQDDEIFENFGQIYMTTTFPNVVKAWHAHKEQTDNIVCLQGMIKLVLCDKRKDSLTYDTINEFFIGEHNPTLVHIPKQVYHGWMCTGDKTATIINIPNKTYNHATPDEIRIAPHNNGKIIYEWRNIDR